MTEDITRSDFPKLDALLSDIEGTVTPQSMSDEDVICDFCQRKILPGERIANYKEQGEYPRL